VHPQVRGTFHAGAQRQEASPMRTYSRLFAGATLALGLGLASLAHAEADKKIERVWKAKCASCHGADGKGATDQGKKMKIADFTTADWQKITDDKIKAAINDGAKSEKDGVKKEMDPFKDELKPEQIDGLVVFMRGLKK
jgi:mono/diheme cytochrome c family protein